MLKGVCKEVVLLLSHCNDTTPEGDIPSHGHQDLTVQDRFVTILPVITLPTSPRLVPDIHSFHGSAYIGVVRKSPRMGILLLAIFVLSLHDIKRLQLL